MVVKRLVSLTALAVALTVPTQSANAAGRIHHGALGAGKCTQLGEAHLCASDNYWVTLKVSGREVDFTAGGKVADGIPGLSVPYEIELDGNRYRVKVENWSTATVEFLHFSEIRFRKRGRRFELAGYSNGASGTDCELGVPYSGDVDFVTGRQVAKVDGKRLWVGPVIPKRLRTPDLFRFKEDQLYKPYKLYDGLAEATKRYCEKSNG